MPNLLSVFISWVKNVNKQRINRLFVCVQLSPIYKKSVRVVKYISEQLGVIQITIPKQVVYFSTYKNEFLSLLNNVYTHNPQGLLLEPQMRN